MPSGKTHDRVTHLVGAPLFAGAWLWHGLGWACPLTLGYYFGGMMFNGDLDLPSLPYRRWGPLRWIWRPYQRAFAHRSRWTHGLVLGPTLRFAYLALLAAAVAVGFGGLHALGWIGRHLAGGDRPVAMMAVAGTFLGSGLHTICDGLGSWAKRAKHRLLRGF